MKIIEFPKWKCPLVFLSLSIYTSYFVDAARSLGEISRVQGVRGFRGEVSCAKPGDDAVLLVVWYRGDQPIFSYDSRDITKTPTRWVDRDFFRERSDLVSSSVDPQAIVLEPVGSRDAGEYRCRVDFRTAPTRNTRMFLSIVVPADKPVIFDEFGKEMDTGRIGPFTEGQDVTLDCNVEGGDPEPNLEWYKDGVIIPSINIPSPRSSTKIKKLIIRGLQRSDRGAVYTCKANNTDLAPSPSTSVEVDMYLRPTKLNIIRDDTPLSAGRRHEINCVAEGSYPSSSIIWYLGEIRLEDFIQKDSEGGNVTTSTLYFTPKREDHGKLLTCRASNPHIEDEHIDKALPLNIHYPPILKLQMGKTLDPKDIEEGDDVYFECKVDANPSAYKVIWKHNNQIIQHNQRAGIITSSTHLAIQSISKSQAGNYTCTASNVEGDGVSNSIELTVIYKPICKDDQKKLYGMAKGERETVSCSVDSVPPPISFRWTFNNTAESRDLNEPFFDEKDEQFTSTLNYTPTSEMDYGTILCYASNVAGRQMEPCVFHVIAGGKPDPPYNCTLLNQTTDSIEVECLGGFDGGQEQHFMMEVYEQESGTLQSNISSQSSHLQANGLPEGVALNLFVFAANTRGRSEPASLVGFTLKKAELQSDKMVSTLDPTTIITIVCGCILILSLVIYLTVSIMRMSQSSNPINILQVDDSKDKATAPVTSSETESLYGDKNPDVIRFNKGTFHREPGFPDSDYQSETSMPLDAEWGVPPRAPRVTIAQQAVQPQHFCSTNSNEHLFRDLHVNNELDYMMDSHSSKMNMPIPMYGNVDYGGTAHSNVSIRPAREIVTVRTPLMFNHQQESCV